MHVLNPLAGHHHIRHRHLEVDNDGPHRRHAPREVERDRQLVRRHGEHHHDAGWLDQRAHGAARAVVRMRWFETAQRFVGRANIVLH